MTYNHASYIEETLNGFCVQITTFPFVCTIIDDASTDGEQDVIKNYLRVHFDLSNYSVSRKEENDEYMLIFAQHKNNLNCYFAVVFLKYNHYRKKNKLSYIAEWLNNSKYQTLCEGDDYWTAPDKLQKQVSFLESHPDYTMCYAKCRYYYQSKKYFEKRSWGGKSVTFHEMLRGNSVPTLTAVVRSSIATEYRKIYLNSKDSSNWLMGDYPLWLYCSIKGRICFMDLEVGVYRILEESASHGKSMQKKMDFSMSMVDIMEYFNKKYNGGYSLQHFERLRGILKLRTYAIYGSFVSFIKEWFSLIKNDPKILFKKGAYLYLLFFLFPSLKCSRM